jgi:hypothetical protein
MACGERLSTAGDRLPLIEPSDHPHHQSLLHFTTSAATALNEGLGGRIVKTWPHVAGTGALWKCSIRKGIFAMTPNNRNLLITAAVALVAIAAAYFAFVADYDETPQATPAGDAPQTTPAKK